MTADIVVQPIDLDEATNILAERKGLKGFDLFLVVAFLLGLYLGLTFHLSATVPVPYPLSGIAGIVMLFRGRHRISPAAASTLTVAVAIYLLATLAAPDLHFLAKRVTGLIQLCYSLLIGYALFLTLTDGTRRQIAGIFLVFSLVLLFGALAEQYLGLRPYSDAFRAAVYRYEILYVSDTRDLFFYGRIRPNVFASEPSCVTFYYTFFTFLWLVLSNWRWKVPFYVGILFPVGLLVLPGPTLLMMLALLVPYHLFGPSSEASSETLAARLVLTTVLICVVGSLLGLVVVMEFSARFDALMNGEDPSFFYRELGPALVAKSVFLHQSLAGAGLTGELSIRNEVLHIFANSRGYSNEWDLEEINGMLTNYFWLHWIYLGPLFGIATLLGLNFWLKQIGVSSALFCWAVWIILGQTMGGYVSPGTWTVLMLSAATDVLVGQRQVSRTVPHYPHSIPLPVIAFLGGADTG